MSEHRVPVQVPPRPHFSRGGGRGRQPPKSSGCRPPPNVHNSSSVQPPSTTIGRHKEPRPPKIVTNSPPTPYDSSELLEALKGIQQTAQCCSCHKLLVSARSCASGHGICSNCRNKCHKVCPLCDSFIPNCKPVMLNSIIKLLPRKCNYSNKGCEHMALASDQDHEMFCRFRNVSCRFPSCGTKWMAKDLLRHLEDTHGKNIIRTASHNSIMIGFDASIERKGFAAIVAFNNIIWQHTKCGRNRVLQLYQYVPMEKPKVKFSVIVNFYTPERSFSAKTPIHIDKFDPEHLFKDKETFCLPKTFAASFSQFYAGVNYNFKIIKEDL
ncbi:E3 ubiquitin-protein ligase siah-1-like [Macrosteles quadrilineatus]|uniref:E3 ubiquitin-protein ligase siah-1-like n=1 Tax=Macrosteles quadrilineatus TaxID=74068 RepID=UPI0023E18F0B|nr:E3 ubiquitin-protein ligase siah-1-like [Macrosteles quadrilineatus]